MYDVSTFKHMQLMHLRYVPIIIIDWLETIICRVMITSIHNFYNFVK